MSAQAVEDFIDQKIAAALDESGGPSQHSWPIISRWFEVRAKVVAMEAVLFAVGQAKPANDCATILLQNAEIERLKTLVSDAREAGSAKHLRLVEAHDMLRKCRDQFQYYADQHMKKSPPDTQKAAVNTGMAILCENVLPEVSGVGASDPTHERLVEAQYALLLFREFVLRNATVWELGSNHHHPIWAHIAAVIGSESLQPVSGPAFWYIQSNNRVPLADLQVDLL